MDGQNHLQSGAFLQLWVRAACAAALEAACEWIPWLETQDFQLCGEELCLCVHLMKITPFLLSYWKEEQGEGQESG